QSSTLFPYTTLFRSELPVGIVDALLCRERTHRPVGVEGLVEADAHDVEPVRAEEDIEPAYRVVQGARLGGADLEAAGVDEAHQRSEEPRLNSSHVKI